MPFNWNWNRGRQNNWLTERTRNPVNPMLGPRRPCENPVVAGMQQTRQAQLQQHRAQQWQDALARRGMQQQWRQMSPQQRSGFLGSRQEMPGQAGPQAWQQQMAGNSSNSQQAPPAAKPQHNRFDQPLPDGVRLEPLNEASLAHLKSIGVQLPEAVPQETAAQAKPPAPAPPVQPLVDTALKPEAAARSPEDSQTAALRQFAQHERNAALFYKHLSGVAPHSLYSDMLNELSGQSAAKQQLYAAMHESFSGRPFAPEETAIDDRINFQEGIRLAITEESRLLRSLTDLYEHMANDAEAKKISGQIARKVSDLSLLHMMNV